VIDLDPELERLLAPVLPQMLATMLEVAGNARSRRLRHQAGQLFRRATVELLDSARRPDTLRGQWAIRALRQSAPAAIAYLTACVTKEKKRNGQRH
jgi:hypothetical protein